MNRWQHSCGAWLVVTGLVLALTACAGVPDFGLFVGDEDGDIVQNIKLVLLSVYLYLIAF